MNLILFDVDIEKFYPLTQTRPVSELRLGVLTIREKWNRLAKSFRLSYHTHDSLREKYPLQIENDNVLIASQILPDKGLVAAVTNLLNNQVLVAGGMIVALRISAEELTAHPEAKSLNDFINDASEQLEYDGPILELEELTDLFKRADIYLNRDFSLIKTRKVTDSLKNTKVYGDALVIKKGAKVYADTINTETGMVYIDKDAEVMEGCNLRGPLYIGPGAVVKMGAKIYGPTVIGPHCKVGGEISNSVILGYSNKGHDGFLGNSIIGEWCNLGADTNTSNLKNNYSAVKRWNYKSRDFQETGLQFCGLIMGDHSKSAINTQFNTGTTVGVSANVFGSKFPPKYVPSFTWLGDDTRQVFQLEKAMEVAVRVMERRNVAFTEADTRLLEYLFSQQS